VSLITPNLPEAALLAAPHAQNGKRDAGAGQSAAGMGCGAVLMKGGHLDDAESPDWLFTREGEVRFTAPRCRPKIPTAPAVRSRRRWRRCVRVTMIGGRPCAEAKGWLSAALAQADSLEVGTVGRFIIFTHGGSLILAKTTPVS
jgi:hydroxymethylpyrimidine/phosphomethylpyrimidine kinase